MSGARPSGRFGRTVLLALLPTLVLALVGATSTQAGARSAARHRIDPRLDAQSCALLGRVWSKGYEVTDPQKEAVGCRVDACIDPAAKVRALTGEEVCYFGSERTGPRYGAFVDVRVCTALHRRWIAPVNMCASNPFRGKALITKAPQCLAGTPLYVTLRETEGYFDECVSRRRFHVLSDAAHASGQNVRQAAIAMSDVNCALRPLMNYRHDQCVARRGGTTRSSGVLITGESVLWRGEDELDALRPDWTVDGLPGRQLDDLSDRIEHAIDTVGTPSSLIVALGTNPTPGYTRADLRSDIGVLGPDEPVMFVLPYRVPGSQATLDSVARYRTWETDLAAHFPATRCVADWPAFVKSHPGILVDGIHPAADREGDYAQFLSDSWDTCEEQFFNASRPTP